MHAALDLLALLEYLPASELFLEGEKRWTQMVGPGSGNIEKAYIPGQAQANAWHDVFVDMASAWDETFDHPPHRQACLQARALSEFTPVRSVSPSRRSL